MNADNLQKISSSFVKSTNQQQAGLACLASVIAFYGGAAEINDLHKNSGATTGSVSLLALCKAARFEGFKAEGFKANVAALKDVDKPIILHISKDSGDEDYIVYYGFHNEKFIIGDPQWGIIEYREDELEAVWVSKTLIFLEPNDSFKSKKDKKRIKKQWFWNHLKQRKKVFAVLGLLGVLSTVFLIVAITLLTAKIEVVFYNAGYVKLSTDWILILLLIFFAFGISYTKSVFKTLGIKSLTADFNELIVKNIFIPVIYNEEINAEKNSTLFKAISQFCNHIFCLFSRGPFYILLFIASLVSVFIISVWLGLILLIAALFLFLIVWLPGKNVESQCILNYTSDIENNNTLKSIFEDFKIVKLSNSENHFKSGVIKAVELLNAPKLKLAGIENKIKYRFFIWGIVVSVFIAASFFLFPVINQNHNEVFRVTIWLIIYLLAAFQLKEWILNYFKAKSSFNYLYKNIGQNSELIESVVQNDSDVENLLIKSLILKNIGFAFPDMYPIFQEKNLSAEIGKITAVYGNTGSGKSVIISILSRLLPLTEGEISVNDLNWTDYNDSEWRNIISQVLQPAQLFNISIIRNIAWGTKVFEPEKIISFCKELGFHKYFSDFTNAYATNSRNLSTGQKQLVSLAAALYRQPKILLLDEPFSGMDEEMEEFCLQLLQRIKNDRLVIIFTATKSIKTKVDTVFCL